MKKTFWAVGVVVALVVARLLVGSGPGPDDRTQILQVLKESLEASKEGKAGSVLDKLSSQFKFNDQEASGSMRQVADFMKQQRPDISVLNQSPIVTGDEARISSDVDLSIGFLGNTQKFNLKDVVIVFKKEPALKWGIVPTHKWFISEVRSPLVPVN